MTAYIIFIREKTTDQRKLDLYAEQAPAAAEGHRLTPLAFYGTMEVLEGAAIEGAVVLSFPSIEEARAWYESPAYQAAREHRLKGAEYRVFMIEGVNS